jgi:hypothetical protein
MHDEPRPRFCHFPMREKRIVIWFYAKEGRHLRCELRQQITGDTFDLVITEPDGSERVEHFSDSASVTRRSQQLEAEWIKAGWDGPFGREY